MSFKKLRQKRWFRILSNKYLLLTIIFTVWMLFFDSNSWLVHRELNQEIDKLQKNEEYYRQEIENDKSIILQLQDEEGLERYAREKYFMKKENEDIYIIEFKDTLKTKKSKKQKSKSF